VNIENNIAKILKKIEGMAELVCVTKGRDAQSINCSISSGVKIIGESRIQEFETKMHDLRICKKHFIGHLQSNKVRKAVNFFDMIQSVDSLKILKKIDTEAYEIHKVQDVLLQVNIGNEPQKYGFESGELEAVLQAGSNMGNIKIKGLMCIAPNVSNTDSFFRVMKEIFDTHKEYGLSILSMGMTNDYESALKEGSNMIRVGTGIFV
jgi:PLP dependent protein